MSGLQRIGMPEGPQNGLAGWAGWLAGWAGLQEVPNSVAEPSTPFGRGPRAGGRSQQAHPLKSD